MKSTASTATHLGLGHGAREMGGCIRRSPLLCSHLEKPEGMLLLRSIKGSATAIDNGIHQLSILNLIKDFTDPWTVVGQIEHQS